MKLILSLILLLQIVARAQTISLTWDASPGATSYRVYQSLDGAPYTVAMLAAITNRVTIPLSTNATTRFYVDALNAGGESGPSNIYTNTPGPPPPPPPVGAITVSVPVMSSTNLIPGQTVTGTARFVNGTSAAFAIATGTLTARRPGASNDSGPFDDWTPQVSAQTLAAGATLTVSGSWTVPTNAPAGQWRSYLAIQGAATGAYIDGPDCPFTVSTTITLPPLPPTNLRSASVSGSRIDLYFDPPLTNVTGIGVERSRDAVFFLPIAALGMPISFYSDTGLQRRTFYTYRVRAFNSAGYSPYSGTTTSRTARR